MKKIGIAAVNNTTNKTYFENEHEVFGIASLIKIAIAVTMFKLYEDGKLNISNQRKIIKSDIFDAGLGDTGILKIFKNDSSISLYNACLMMLSLSDNTATNFLLRHIPQKTVNKTLQELGFKTIKLTVDRLSIELFDDPTNFIGLASAFELLQLLEKIVTSKLLSETSSANILKMMEVQQITHKIPRLLPSVKNYKDESAEIVSIASKTGEYSSLGLDHDMAVLTNKKGEKIIMIILTKSENESENNMKLACIDHESPKKIAALALDIYNRIS